MPHIRPPAVNGHPRSHGAERCQSAVQQDESIRAGDWSRVKVVLDFVLAAVLLVVLCPVILLLMLLVRLTSTGPAIFRQQRVGIFGRVFTMYKLRTMRIDAEFRTGAVWASEHDPRCTRLGRWMRHLHLDELPQLVNVLRGQMALVGPRPERPEFVLTLAEEIPGYLDRHCVRPGITGLAQILLPPDQDTTDVERKLAVDLYYVRTSGVGMDLRIVFFTGLRLLRIPVWLCNRVVRLPTVAAIPGLIALFGEEHRGPPTPAKVVSEVEPQRASVDSALPQDMSPATDFSTVAPMFLRNDLAATDDGGSISGPDPSL